MTCKRTKIDVSTALAIFYSCLSPGQHLYKMHSTKSPLGVLFDWLFTCVLFFSPFFSCIDSRGYGSSCRLQDVVNSCQCCFIVIQELTKLHCASSLHC